MRAFLVGRTLVGMRAADITRGVDLLSGRPEVDTRRIYGFGVGAGAVALLHEAALDNRVTEVVLKRMLVSYHAADAHRMHRNLYESIVPGALKVYDLPDVAAALAPRPIWIVNAQDPLERQVSIAEATRAYARTVESFKSLGAEPAFHVMVQGTEEPLRVFDDADSH
jgi:hypothetical protein